MGEEGCVQEEDAVEVVLISFLEGFRDGGDSEPLAC